MTSGPDLTRRKLIGAMALGAAGVAAAGVGRAASAAAAASPAAAGTAGASRPAPTTTRRAAAKGSGTRPNVLLVVVDDWGSDADPLSGVPGTKPKLPTLAALADRGVRFENAWTHPECTPTRAALLTGKYGFRTGVLAVDDPLPVVESSVFREATSLGYASALFGKWHLGGRNGALDHPRQMGVPTFSGVMGGALPDYSRFPLVTDGVQSIATGYATSVFTDAATTWIARQQRPWFCWLAYTAPHAPFHAPPAGLSHRSVPSDSAAIAADPLPNYLAAMEALDTELGRLLRSLTASVLANTVIIVTGDNGTPRNVAQTYVPDRVKGTVYQGGINAPLMIAGPAVPKGNRTSKALVNSVDIAATIVALMGGAQTFHDGRSIHAVAAGTETGVRDLAYSESAAAIDRRGRPVSGAWAVRGATHKLVHFDDGTEELYALSVDPYETNPLPLTGDAAATAARLRALGVQLRGRA